MYFSIPVFQMGNRGIRNRPYSVRRSASTVETSSKSGHSRCTIRKDCSVSRCRSPYWPKALSNPLAFGLSSWPNYPPDGPNARNLPRSPLHYPDRDYLPALFRDRRGLCGQLWCSARTRETAKSRQRRMTGNRPMDLIASFDRKSRRRVFVDAVSAQSRRSFSPNAGARTSVFFADGPFSKSANL